METLIPLQEEYRTPEGNSVLVTTLEINGGVDVAPPDVDIKCTQKDFDSE